MADLADILTIREAASEQLPVLRAHYDALQKSRTALESACTITRDNERRLDDEKRDSNRRLQEAQNRLQKFARVATKPVCDLCGQEITGEHAKQEQIRLQQLVEGDQSEVAAVTQQHQDAVDLKKAKERELKELDDLIREVRDSYGQAKHEQQTMCEQTKDHQKRLRRAFLAMSEHYRERISGTLPEDRAAWLATSYPLPGDREIIQQDVKGKAHQAREVKQISGLHEKWRGFDQQRAVFAQQISEQERDIDLDATRNARIEKKDVEKQQNELTAESEGLQRELEQATKVAQETEDALTSLHEQTQHCENELRAETARREEKERVQLERESILPIPWRSRANTLEKRCLIGLEQRRTDLACYRSLHEQLTSARVLLERYQKRINELDVQILAYPAEAKRPAIEVEGALLGRKEAYRLASAERDKAKDRLGVLEGKHERLQALEQQKLESERMQHLYAILSKHLGKSGLQLHLLKRAERAITEFANQTLNGLSHGRLRLEWPHESDTQAQTDKALDVVGRDQEIGNYAVPIGSVSGSQKFRIAISLAMAIGRYMSRDGRHLESVIIDEGFGGLDKAGRNDMIQELRTLGEYVARIILVSHQEAFAYAFPNRYHFKLVDGSSRVTLMDEEESMNEQDDRTSNTFDAVFFREPANVLWDPQLTLQLRVLLHADRLLSLQSRDDHRLPEFQHYASLSLALKLFDLIITNMGLGLDIEHRQAIEELLPLLEAMDRGAGIEPERARAVSMAERVLETLYHEKEQRGPFKLDYTTFEQGEVVRCRNMHLKALRQWATVSSARHQPWLILGTQRVPYLSPVVFDCATLPVVSQIGFRYYTNLEETRRANGSPVI